MNKSILLERIGSLSAPKRDEYREIFDSHFKDSPRRTLEAVLRRYGLGRRKTLDFGCAWGASLIHFGPGSLGIDISERCALFAHDTGLPVKRVDIFEEEYNLQVADDFEAAWCCNVLEHVASPHTVLIRLRQKLQGGGLIFVTVPIIPKHGLVERCLRSLLKLKYGHKKMSYLSSDHINAFTARSLAFTVERAGFRVVEVDVFPLRGVCPGLLRRFLVHDWSSVTVVGEKIGGWDYPRKASRRLSGRGWRYKAEGEGV
jgi:SAM-dependent methyltransferase